MLTDEAARPIQIGADGQKLAEVDVAPAVSPGHFAATSPISIEESSSGGGELRPRHADGATRRIAANSANGATEIL